MSRRWAWWTGAGLIVAVLLAAGALRIAREMPERVRMAGDVFREEAAKLGLRVTYKSLDFHPFSLRVTIDTLEVEDAVAGLLLARAETVDASISPRRILSGLSPVSRVRVANYALRIVDANRPLLDRLRTREGSKEPLPDIHLVGGRIGIGPLGPVTRLDATLTEVRIRPVTYMGTRVDVAAKEVDGELSVPGHPPGALPFSSVDADLFVGEGIVRIRRFSAEGRSASLRLSGVVDPRRGEANVTMSGKADIGGLIAAGVPGGPWLGRFVQGGKVDYSASAEGTFAAPAASARLVMKDARLKGGTEIEGEIAAAASGGRVSVELARGKLWGGSLAGRGTYEPGKGAAEGSLSLAGASFGEAPWRELGLPIRPAGKGTVDLSFSGTTGRLAASISLSNPDGFERAEGENGAGIRSVRLPLSATVAGELVDGTEIVLGESRVQAGEAVLTGTGAASLSGRTVDLSGRIDVSAGRAADYGWAYPLSFAGVSGGWHLEGEARRPRIAAGIEARELAVRALPPVPVSVKLEGGLGEIIHFVADIPAGVAKMTAAGTVTGPLSDDPPILEATAGVREIDFAQGSRWVAAVLASLGRDSRGSARYLGGLAGRGSADILVSLAPGAVTVSGTLSTPEIAIFGGTARAVTASGRYGLAGKDESWEADAEARFGGGAIRLSGDGGVGTARIEGEAQGVDLATIASFVDREAAARVRGSANARGSARWGSGGWEGGLFSADAAEMNVTLPGGGEAPAGVAIGGVAAEGTFDGEAARIVLFAASPKLRATADVRREKGWPISFALAAEEVSSGVLLSAGGRAGIPSGGTWAFDARGTARGADLFSDGGRLADALDDLRFSVRGAGPRASGVSFDTLEVDGRKEGDTLAGEIRTRRPDSGLAFVVSLREPLSFRIDGPFGIGMQPAGNGAAATGEPAGNRLSLAGTARISGALRAIEKTRGTLRVDRFGYREGGVEFSGRDVAVQLDGEGIRWAGGEVQAAGNPVRVTGKASWGGELDARMDGRIPAAAVRLVTDVFERLDGTMKMDVRLTGNWRNPSVVGTGRLEGGIFSFRGYGQLFEEMTAEAVISREKIVFEHFAGRSGGGYLDGWGELPLKFDARQRMLFSVDFFDMRYPYPDDFRPVLQGHVELLGPIEDLLVTGEVEVQSARYVKVLQPEKVFLDFRRRLADVTARREKSEFRVRLDIDAVADGTIRIKNNLGEAEAKGEFKIVGDTGKVVILGTFDVIEGFVDYRGNRYDLKRLSVDFQDPRRNNPILDARAETRKGNVTVTVAVTGTLDKYEVEMFSDPPLGKNDIVALLSLGVTTGGLAGAEGSVSMGEAAAIALGPYKGRVEEGIRGIVGLDKFAIEPGFSTTSKAFEPKFIVGKTFGEKASVSVSTTVGTTAQSSATAEYKVLENVFLQGAWESATTTREGDLGADLKFRYRYRQLKDLLRGRD